MTFHASLSFVAFSAFVTLPSLSYFVSLSNIFSHCFPLLFFSSIIPVVTRSSSFSFLITWPKKVGWRVHSPFMSDLLFWLLVTMFRLISLQFMRFVAFSKGTTLWLRPVSVVPVLKLSSNASIHQNGFNKVLQFLIPPRSITKQIKTTPGVIFLLAMFRKVKISL